MKDFTALTSLIDDLGRDFDKLIKTDDTLDMWVTSSKTWTPKTPALFGTIAGYSFVAWAIINPAKGSVLPPLSVIDMGDYRIVLEIDLTNYN